MKRRAILLHGVAAATLVSFSGCASSRAQTARQRWEPAFKRLENTTGGRLGVAVLDTATGERASWRGNDRFPMCSTFKLAAAALVLQRVEQGRESLLRRVVFPASDVLSYAPVTKSKVGVGMTMEELCDASVTMSDNTAGNLSLASFGGPEHMTRYFRQLGDTASRLDRIEPDLNECAPGDPRDTTTPDAMNHTIHRLLISDALSPASRQRLLGWLLGNKVGDTRLRAGVPKDWRVADKTGAGANGTNNDVGLLLPPSRPPIVVSVYMTGATAEPTTRDAVIAQVARLVSNNG